MSEHRTPDEIIGQRVGGEPSSEAEHFFVCGDCGQSFDMRRLDEVLYHTEPDHVPRSRQ